VMWFPNSSGYFTKYVARLEPRRNPSDRYNDERMAASHVPLGGGGGVGGEGDGGCWVLEILLAAALRMDDDAGMDDEV